MFFFFFSSAPSCSSRELFCCNWIEYLWGNLGLWRSVDEPVTWSCQWLPYVGVCRRRDNNYYNSPCWYTDTSSSFLYPHSTFLLVTTFWGGGHQCTKKRKVSGDGLCARPCVMHSLKDVRGPFFLPSTSPICLLNHSYLCSRGLDKNMKDVKRAKLFFLLFFVPSISPNVFFLLCMGENMAMCVWDDLSVKN